MKSQIRIPLARPSFDEREVEAVRRVLEGGWVVQGPEVAAFEEGLTERHQIRHAVAVSSGTAALHVCFLSLEIGPGDALFIPSFAWPSAANAAALCGARPVLVDVLPDTYNLDPADLEKKIALCHPKRWGMPRAVVVVHEFGLAAELEEISRIARTYDLAVIEDAACALGACYQDRPVGGFGLMGTFSFHPRKAITMGEGGAIVTNDDALAEKCRWLRNHGQASRNSQRDFVLHGLNYRLTEIQAAIGRVQLEKFPGILEKRKEIAAAYMAGLGDSGELTLPAAPKNHTWQTFMIVLDDAVDRLRLITELAESGIEAAPGSVAAHTLEVFQKRLGYRNDDLPVSLRLDRLGLALPVHPFMSESDVFSVCRSLKEAVGAVVTGAG